MRFYTKTHKHYCGIDLHACKMFLCILNAEGEVLLHRNIASSPDAFLKTVAPFRGGLVVGVDIWFLSTVRIWGGCQQFYRSANYLKNIISISGKCCATASSS